MIEIKSIFFLEEKIIPKSFQKDWLISIPRFLLIGIFHWKPKRKKNWQIPDHYVNYAWQEFTSLERLGQQRRGKKRCQNVEKGWNGEFKREGERVIKRERRIQREGESKREGIRERCNQREMESERDGMREREGIGGKGIQRERDP